MIDDDDYLRPDSTHSALIIIDVQRDATLARAAIEIPGTLQAVPFIKRLVQTYRNVGLPISHVVRLYNKMVLSLIYVGGNPKMETNCLFLEMKVLN